MNLFLVESKADTYTKSYSIYSAQMRKIRTCSVVVLSVVTVGLYNRPYIY